MVKLTRSAFVEAVLGAFPILELDVTVARVHARLWAGTRDFGRIPGLALEPVTR